MGHTYFKVILRHRCRKLQYVSRRIDSRVCTIAFYRIIVRGLFLEPAYLHIMELGRNTRQIRIARTAIMGEFIQVCMRNRIPVYPGFVFTVRGIPHNFCRIGAQVTYRDILDISAFDHVERRKAERSLQTVYQPLFRRISASRIRSRCIEIVRSTRQKVAQDNFVHI